MKKWLSLIATLLIHKISWCLVRKTSDSLMIFWLSSEPRGRVLGAVRDRQLNRTTSLLLVGKTVPRKRKQDQTSILRRPSKEWCRQMRLLQDLRCCRECSPCSVTWKQNLGRPGHLSRLGASKTSYSRTLGTFQMSKIKVKLCDNRCYCTPTSPPQPFVVIWSRSVTSNENWKKNGHRLRIRSHSLFLSKNISHLWF